MRETCVRLAQVVSNESETNVTSLRTMSWREQKQ